MKDTIMNEIKQSMLRVLDNSQMMLLDKTLQRCFGGVSIILESETNDIPIFEYTNIQFIDMFISAKEIEGCSKKTLNYYRRDLNKELSSNTHVTQINTEYLRNYLSNYKENNKCNNSSVDTVRRVLSSFFSWLEEENYIIKSPMKRIHKIKSDKTIKETYSDENLELLRDSTSNLRDLVLIDILASTGMRVGELVKLNINNIDFENRECIVFGKDSKQRPVYFDARTKMHLTNYLDSRNDDNDALFVSQRYPYSRLEASGVEKMLKVLGKRTGLKKVHPHKFRRTMATRAIDKGMLIEQVQSLLGHSQIDITLQYAMVNQSNVKISHRKYIG